VRSADNHVLGLEDLRHDPDVLIADRAEILYGEPRLPDLVLARRLGFEKPHNIRKLIERNMAELESYGPLPAEPTNILRDGEKSRRHRGRPGTAYLLSEAQCLVACALSRTPAAAQVRREIVHVFMAWRAGATPEAMIMRHLANHAEVLPAGDVAFLIAPVTAVILDALSAFESDASDMEDGADAEPSLSGINVTPTYGIGLFNLDLEANGDEAEPTLGAPEHHPLRPPFAGPRHVSRHVHDDQRLWAAGDNRDGDREPSLGSANDYHGSASQARWGEGSPATCRDDREGPEDDLEPSLGADAGSKADQTGWAFTGTDDDAEEEHDGREPYQGDEEPSFGATACINQEHAWRPSGDFFWGGGEGEPSLGWSNRTGHGHPEPVSSGYDADTEVNGDEHDGNNGDYPDDLEPAHYGGGYGDVPLARANEQGAMRRAAAGLKEIVCRVRAVDDARPQPLPGIVDIIGPAGFAGLFARIQAVS
jgi:hypothetical protein